MTSPLEVVAVNRVLRQALLSDDRLVPITNWFGPDGEECSPDQALTCACGSDETGWFAVRLSEFVVGRVN